LLNNNSINENMPRTKKQNEEMKEITISKIKDAGLKLFSTKGLAATSILDISESAGISAGLMYHYYKSKEDLYTELVMLAVSKANSVFFKVTEMQISPKEKITFLTRTIFEGIMKDDNNAQFFIFMTQILLNKSLSGKIKPYIKDAFIVHELLMRIIISGQKSGEIKNGDPVALSIFFFASINGLATYKLILGREFVMPEYEWVNQLFFN
ncbi:MAG: TetR/AcrR family transcriptional regulator, partial [Prevotella sp.]|nr:TetR/AcrR family transcriptional regulator [Prevotella sp.]